MSLTSRIASIFSTSPPPRLAPSDETPSIGAFGPAGYGVVQDSQTERDRRKLQEKTMEEEEVARPPYLHVRGKSFLLMGQTADCLAVNDCGRYRWNDRRSFDAFD